MSQSLNNNTNNKTNRKRKGGWGNIKDWLEIIKKQKAEGIYKRKRSASWVLLRRRRMEEKAVA